MPPWATNNTASQARNAHVFEGVHLLIAELTGSSRFRARKKDEVSSEIISGKYQFLLEKKIFFHKETRICTMRSVLSLFSQAYRRLSYYSNIIHKELSS